MKKASSFIIAIFFTLCLSAKGQQDNRQFLKAMDYLDNGGEVYFTFDLNLKSSTRELTQELSIDNIEGTKVYAYANKEEFKKFVERGIYYEVKTHPGDMLAPQTMAASPQELRLEWDKYPTYEAYVETMYDFQTRYPELCKIVKIGSSIRGRDLLYAVISDNVNTTEAEPRHMYTSAMHGDETTMYVNFLRLIDYLLTRYPTDALVKKLVDNVEIWICPLENPDATYLSGNNTVNGARRANANGTDLNRHYPPAGQPLPDDYLSKDPEAAAVIRLTDSLQFNLSANAHGGSELLNYPFDYANVIHKDEQWMNYVYKQWADTVHSISATTLTGQNNGIVRGYVWYQILGSRMDYLTYHRHMREVTFEASGTKLIPGSDFPRYWDIYYRSLLRYIEQNLYGIRGTVKSATTDAPLAAKVKILDHDNTQTAYNTKLPHGDFYRPIAEGTYSVEFSSPGYISYVEDNVSVNWNTATVLDIKLTPEAVDTQSAILLGKDKIQVVPQGHFVKFLFNNDAYPPEAFIVNLKGEKVQSFFGKKGSYEFLWDGKDLNGIPVSNGFYQFVLKAGKKKLSKSFVLSR